MAAAEPIDAETSVRPSGLAPVAPGDRIFNLDMLRGWAILGILAVNAFAFAWPVALEASPGLVAPYPNDAGNILGHWVVDVFFQDKFRSLFSMLFGVSIFLIGGERDADEARGRLLRSRLFWLALFGLIHGLAFWFGDILLHYAYTGALVMLVRSWSAGRLIRTGLLVSLVIAAASVGLSLLMPMLTAMSESQTANNPVALTKEGLEAIIAAYQSGWPGILAENLKSWITVQFASVFLIPVTGGLMMLGLGLFKSGFLIGKSSTGLYLLVFALGAANLAVLGWYDWIHFNAPLGAPDPTGGLSGVAGSFAWVITLGYVSMLILMTKFGLRFLTARLAPVGQMAFSNYLTQTLIMTSLFYMPWGLHLFGDPEWGPGRLWMAVGGIWVAQLIWSPLWLSMFRMGPLEWIWRCLTYKRVVPLLRG